MPSHLKFKIKHPDESQVSPYSSYPTDLIDIYKESNAVISTDYNIHNHTCAFLGRRTVRVGTGERSVYLCFIKEATKDFRLKPAQKRGKIQDEDQFIVSGAEQIKSSGDFVDRAVLEENWAPYAFKCKYFNSSNGEADLEQGNPEYNDTLVRACICSCYAPRGGAGLGVNYDLYQGAIKHLGSYDYNPELTLYEDAKNYEQNKTVRVGYRGPLIDDMPDYGKYKAEASSLPYLYMVLNARAAVIPCCYWVRSAPLFYEPYWFRVVDMYYAKIEGLKAGGYTERATNAAEKVKDLLVEGYTYIESDYYPPINKENEDKNRLLGRNFDFTLPYIQKGNNPRIRSFLKEEYTGELVKDDDESPYCKKYGSWHFHNKAFFCPENCGHPDYTVRYKWGCHCNGGGSFDLDAGIACPYYYNPLFGDYRQERHASLQKMYPGAHVTGAAILELMWLAKGGEPWTEEEWRAIWKTPDIWVHLAHSPVSVSEYGDYEQPVTTLVYTRDGVPRDVVNYNRDLGDRKHTFYQQRIESKRYKINLDTGIVDSDPPIFLGGGTKVNMKVGSDGKLAKHDDSPDFPTFVQKLELEPVSKIRITFPRFEWESENIDPSTPEEYQEKISLVREESSKTYNKLYWTQDGVFTLLMGFVSGAYNNKVYCINLAFLINKWAESTNMKKLTTILKSNNYLKDSNQLVLDEFFTDLLNSCVGGSLTVLGDLNAYDYQSLGDGGSFLFRNIPLNPLVDKNIIMILTQHRSGRWDVASIQVRPQFRHAWVYQKNTTLMSDWKSFDGQPRRITKGGSILTGKASEYEQSVLEIPEDSGLTTWNYGSISQPHGTTSESDSAFDVAIKDVYPYKTYQPAYIDKLHVYDSREDVGDIGIKVDPNSENELGVSEWHLLAACSPYVLFVGDPTIFNADTEAMIFDMTAVIKDSKGNEVSRVSLIPVVYSQVDRIFPGYRENNENNWSVEYEESFWEREIFKEVDDEEPIKTITANGIVEVDNPLANLYLDEEDHHPWIMIAKAVDIDRDSLGTWKDLLDDPVDDENENPIVLIKSLTDLYVNFGYIKDRTYKLDGKEETWSSDEVTTQIAPRAPGNIYRTLFKYIPFNDDYKVDGFDEVIYGAKTMHALWPYHRIGCRDIEISYTWHNMMMLYACSPYSYYCYGARTPRGSLKPFVGKALSGKQNQKNLIGIFTKFHPTCCGDHDFTRACGGGHGPMWYPYIGGCPDVPRYEHISDCLFDFSYALPYDLLQDYLAGNFTALGLERLRGPIQYQPNCIRNSSVWPFPCFEQTIFENAIRSIEPNSFDGWFKCRGPVYPEDFKSVSPQGTIGSLPVFGNTGREIWMVDLCYMKEKSYGIRGGLNDITKNYTVFETPNNQAQRSLKSLTYDALNPFNYYIITDSIFNESFIPEIDDYKLPAKDLIVRGVGGTVGYQRPTNTNGTTYWAWPEWEKDILSRGVKFIRKNDKEGRNSRYKVNENLEIGGLVFECPNYKKMSRNKDISLGPEVSEFDGEMKSYYLIYAKSEYYEKGLYYKPILASKKLSSPSVFPFFTESDFDIDLKYHVTANGITNETISGSKHLINSSDEAANFITSTSPLTIEEDNPIPVLYIQSNSVCVPVESTTSISGLVTGSESQDLEGCIPVTRDGTLLPDSESSDWGLQDYGYSGVDTINKSKRIVKYVLEDLWIGANPLRSLELVFHNNVRNWVNNNTGSVSLNVEVLDTSGQYVYVSVGSVSDETGAVVEVGFTNPSPQNKITVTLFFYIGEWLTSIDTYNSVTPTVGVGVRGSSYHFSPTESGDVGDPTQFWSTFWVSNLANVLVAMSVYGYKYSEFYPGLNVTSVDPQYLAKVPSSKDLNIESNFSETKFGPLSILTASGNILDISESYTGVYITYDSTFIENEDLQIEWSFEGQPADSSLSSIVGKTITHELPMTKSSMFYELDLPVCTKLNYTFIIRALRKERLEIKNSSGTSHIPTDKDDSYKLKLEDCIDYIKAYVLKPGECAEIIEIDQVGFWRSLGNQSLRNNFLYDFYTQSTTDMYEIKWIDDPLSKEEFGGMPQLPVVIPENYDTSAGVWTSDLSADDLIGSRSPIVPAPHFGEGYIKTKGRYYIFNNQYKDCWDVNLSRPANDPKYCKNVVNAPATDVVDKYEQYQKELWRVARNLNNDNYYIKTSFKVSPHEWLSIEELTGKKIKDLYGTDLEDAGDRSVVYNRNPITKKQLDNIRVSNCYFTWHQWTWDEVVDFSFEGKERQRYGPPGPPETYGGLATWSPPGHVVDFVNAGRTMIKDWGWSSTLGWVILFLSLQRSMYAWTDFLQAAWAYDQASEEFWQAIDGYGNPAEAHVLNERYQQWIYKNFINLLETRDKKLSAGSHAFIKGNYLWYLQFQKHMEVVDKPVEYDSWTTLGIF